MLPPPARCWPGMDRPFPAEFSSASESAEAVTIPALACSWLPWFAQRLDTTPRHRLRKVLLRFQAFVTPSLPLCCAISIGAEGPRCTQASGRQRAATALWPASIVAFRFLFTSRHTCARFVLCPLGATSGGTVACTVVASALTVRPVCSMPALTLRSSCTC
jgi:hypothetical protein